MHRLVVLACLWRQAAPALQYHVDIDGSHATIAYDAGERETRLDVSADAGALRGGFGGRGGLLLEESLRLGGLGGHRASVATRGLDCAFSPAARGVGVED